MKIITYFVSLLLQRLTPFVIHICTKYLENETIKKWCWDSEFIDKAQALLAACRKCDHIIAFTVLFHGLEPTKPLVTK